MSLRLFPCLPRQRATHSVLTLLSGAQIGIWPTGPPEKQLEWLFLRHGPVRQDQSNRNNCSGLKLDTTVSSQRVCGSWNILRSRGSLRFLPLFQFVALAVGVPELGLNSAAVSVQDEPFTLGHMLSLTVA
ncbi:hypothetical protein Q1695_002321 [Nippostrongylus brasiliensis]|nr:hypothetical protein Q1695_002321 [Nippostrongylus brasiliensis]